MATQDGNVLGPSGVPLPDMSVLRRLAKEQLVHLLESVGICHIFLEIPILWKHETS